MKKGKIILNGKNLKIEDVVKIARFGFEAELAKESKKAVQENWTCLEELLEDGEILYGVNTGIGGFGNEILTVEEGAELSKRMIRSHAAGVGNPVNEEIAIAAMLLRANVLAKGYSGLRLSTLETLFEMINKRVTPVIYEKGSVGTSGDLAPLAQMALVVFGEGEAFYKRKRMPGADAMNLVGIKPVRLKPREGLALFNGAQFMTAIAALNVYDSERLIKTAEVSASMTIDVLNCVMKAYDERLHALRPFEGQMDCAANIRLLTQNSEILKQEKKDTQSSYSLRCTPQVNGASRDTLAYARKQVEIEMNSVADNPVFLTKEKECITGGNFHGQPIAYAMDFLGIAISEIANISERRTNRILNPNLNKEMPGFLAVGKKGLNTGLMIAQYTQAALVSENKVLATPASVDSIPVSGDQEDHVSMGTISARKCRDIIWNASNVIAIELICGAQALDILRPLKAGIGAEAAYSEIRKKASFYENDDAPVYPRIEVVAEQVMKAEIIDAVEAKVGELK